MKFKEYQKQIEQSKKRPAFSVIVTEDDIHAGWEVGGRSSIGSGHEVSIFVAGEYLVYFVPKGKVELYTIDKHGNRKKASCFKLDKPLTL